jgi:SAM-dependent methyltransferase
MSGTMDAEPHGRASDDDRSDPATYGRSFADVYDAWYEGVTDAEATAGFVAARAGGRPVLELGVGTGRLARPMRDRGSDVVGVDASAAMLRRTIEHDRRAPAGERRRGRADLILADMAALPLRARYGAVLIGFNTLFNLGTAAGQRQVLAQLPALLAPGGVVIVEADDLELLASGAQRSIGVRERTRGGVVVVAASVDPAAQVIAGQHVELTGAGVRFRPWLLRWATPREIDRFAAEAGLRLVERHGGWDERAYTAGHGHVSVFAATTQRPPPGA